MTPLIACCKSGNDELLKFFLEKERENDPTLIKLRRRAKDN